MLGADGDPVPQALVITGLVVASVIDNLAKGAAGGGIQWMNRQFGLSDACGLGLGGPGWF